MEPWLWRRALREGWSELGGWSREEMEAAEKEIWRGESSEISQLGEWVCDACLEGYLGGGVGDYSELRSGYVAPYPSNPWIGRSRDLSWMRKGPIGVTRREALLAAEEAKAAARAAEKAARAAEGGKGGGSGRQSREARRRKGSSSRGGVRTARREDEEPEPGEGWEGGARPEECVCVCVCVCAARCMAKNSSRHTPRAYALARREAHAPRRGGGMCNDTARDAFRGPEIKLL